MIDCVVGFFNSVPVIIWVAVITPTLTIGGVLLTNRHHTKQQQARLDHESAQNDEDRKFELRESVYLEAAAELSQAQTHMMNMANLDDAAAGSLADLSGIFDATTKACLVASDETAKKINDLLLEYSLTFLDLIVKTMPMRDVQIDRDIANSSYEEYSAEVKRLLSSMTQYNEQGKADAAVWESLNNNFEFNKEQMTIASDERDKAWAKLLKLQNKFRKEIFSRLEVIGKLTVPALVAIREELGIPSDLEAYYSEQEKLYAKAAEAINSFMDKIPSECD